ncbi:hypothetical protein Tco_0135154 [Tanacetum coccineum]
MSTLVEFMIHSGGDYCLPMLEKHLYDSWKSRMELYMQNKEHGRMILESIEHGPLIWLTIEANDVYSLVNHHIVAKDLWERVQLLMQVNTKFLNNLPPEWSKFVTNVKLIRDLHTTKFDQIHAYLEQHELHANEVRIMRERNQDPLALVANHQMTPSHFNTYQSSYNNPQFQQQFSPSQSPQYGLIHPTQHYSTTYPSTPHFRGDKVHLLLVLLEQGITSQEQKGIIQCPKPKRKKNATWFRDKVLLVEVQGSGKVLNEEEMEFLADLGVAEGPVTQTVITDNATYQSDDLDAYDSNCDDFSTAKAIIMANLSSYGSDVLSEVPHSKNTHNDILNQSV